MMDLQIDKEFRSLIPPLTPDEYVQLEASIKRDGCRDSLVTWDEKKILLDGHNRLEICKRLNVSFKSMAISLKDREAAIDWIICNQLGRRNLTRDQWEYLLGTRYNRIKHQGKRTDLTSHQNDGKSTAETLALEYGVSKATVERAGKTASLLDANPREKEAVIRKRKRLREVKKDLQKERREQARKEAAKDIEQTHDNIFVGDFRELGDKIPDGSLSLIFTDPPYNRKAAEIFAALSEFAEKKLADGGSLICYVGQIQLPKAITDLAFHLRYWWTIACLHSGKSTVMTEYGIHARWKPMLWFVKKTRHNNQEFVNDVITGGQEKTHHEWQQAEGEAEYWISKLCPVDGIVCDPLLGAGTTAMVAERLKRKWIGFEIDPATAKIATRRIFGKD
jgi:16S rRNA G966 N2-methylase RsmD